MNIIFIGPPGSGKGTMAEKLVEKYELLHLSTGDMLRDNIRKDTELGRIAKTFMDEGHLVPDELIIRMVGEVLKSEKRGVLFDGFPRTAEQAKALLKITKIDAVMELDASLELVSERILGRMICPACGKVFASKHYKKNTCDHCGAELYHRSDDTEETVKERYLVYTTYADAIKECFAELNILHKVNADDSIETVVSEISEVLDNLL